MQQSSKVTAMAAKVLGEFWCATREELRELSPNSDQAQRLEAMAMSADVESAAANFGSRQRRLCHRH